VEQQQQKDPKFRESITVLERLQRCSISALDVIARDNGLVIKQIHEDYRTYISRIWTSLTGRTDFDLAHSTLCLLDTFKPPREPEKRMRDMIQRQVQTNLDDIKIEDAKTDKDFLKLLKQV